MKLLLAIFGIIVVASIADLYRRTFKMATKQDQLDAFVTRLDAVSNELAADLTDLHNQIADKVDQATLDKLGRTIATLESMGSDPKTPFPDEPPTTEPTA